MNYKQIQVGEEILEFPDSMSDDDILKILRKQYPPQANWSEVPGIAAGRALDTAQKGITMAGAGAGKFVEDLTGWNPRTALTKAMQGGDDISAQDAMFKGMEERSKALQQYFNPRNAQPSFMQDVTGMAATLPAQIANLPFQAAERGTSMVEAGESADVAQRAAGADALLNAASVGLPAAARGSVGTRIATGAGSNMALGGASDQYAYTQAETKAGKDLTDPFSEEGLKRRLMEAMIGGSLGLTVGKAQTTKSAKDIDIKNNSTLDAIDNTKKPPPGGEQLELPLSSRLPDLQGDLFDGFGPDPRKPVVPEPVKPIPEEAQLELFDQPSMGRVANPYEAKLGDWRIDENGMPIKADLSMEVQNMQNPLQRNLWGDELEPTRSPVGQSATLFDEGGMQMAPTNLTDAIDNMDPASRTKAINERMVGEIDDGPTKAAVLEAANSIQIVPPKRDKITKSQRGAINPSSLREDMVDSKDLGNGYRLVAYTQESGSNVGPYRDLVIRVYDETGELGGVVFGVDKPFGPAKEAAMMAMEMPFIKEDARGQGLGKAMYDFAASLGNDVKETHLKTKYGQALWRSMEEHGMTNESPTGERYIPRKQRGGAKGTWNPFKVKQEITDFAKRISDTLSKGWPKSEDQMKGDAMKRIPGMRDVTYIPEDVPFSPEIKQKILTEKDGPGIFGQNVTPGFVMYKEFWKSTLVQNVGRAFENARNRYEALKNNQLSDMKKTLNKVMNKPEEAKMLHDIFMREFKNGSKYTPEELAQAGVPPRVIEAHAALRTNFDAVLKLQNDALKAKGKPEIKGLEAYFSSRFLGPWKAIARTADGKPVWSISERSALGRARAIKYLKKHAPDLQITDMKYDSTFTPGADSLMAGYRTMIQLLGPEDPAVQRIKELMEAYAREDTENVAGQEQHFKKKTGRRGFAGDRPWAKNDARDFIQQQLEYIENGMQWAEQQKALEQAKLYTEDPEIVKAQPNNVKYIQDLAKAEMGIGTLKEMKNVEDALGKYTGWNPNSYARGLGISKSIFYMKQLGMNLPFMTISLLQPGLVLLPSHLHAGTNMLKGLAGAAIDGPAMAAKQLAEDMMASNRFTSEVDMRTFEFSDKLAQEAYEFAKANRVTELSQLSETRDISQPQSVLLAEKTIGATISGPELVSRSMMYMSFVRGLEGKFDTSTREGRLALFQKAAELTQFSMGVYEPTQKPLAYQKMGMAGNALFTLQTFIFNQLGQVSTYGKDFAKGNPLPLTAYLFSMWAFAGAMGMIGIDDAEELLNTIKRNVPSSVYAKIKDWSIKDFILQNMGETGAYGLASKLSGTNIYTRASMGDILNLGIFESDNTTFLESYLPFLTTMAKDAGAVATLATNPTEIEKRQAQYQLTPTGFRGLFEENVSGMKDGNAVRVPSNLKREASVRRTPEESALRETGFRSLREQQQIDRGFSAQTQTKIGDVKRTNAANRLVDHALVNDWAKFQKELPTFIELDGDLNQVVTQLNTVQKKRLFTIIEAEAYKEPKTMAQAKKVIKYQKILNDLRQ